MPPQDKNDGQRSRRVSPGNAATGSATGDRAFPRRRGRRLRPPGELMRFPRRAPNVPLEVRGDSKQSLLAERPSRSES